MVAARKFDDEISYQSEPDTHARPSARVLDLCHESAIGQVIGNPEHAVSVFLPMMLTDRETLAVMCLDSRRAVINAFVAAVGTVDTVQCEPSAIFRPAVLLGASYILIAHNHPSGDPTPSDPDIQTTIALEACARILGIGFVDHLVLTATGRFRSIAEYMFVGC